MTSCAQTEEIANPRPDKNYSRQWQFQSTRMANSTRNKETAHAPKVYKTSEFIGIIILALALTLQYSFPWNILSENSALLVNSTGTLFLLLGIAILRWTHWELKRYNQPHAPGVPTTKLIQSGPFYWSRNPIYTAIVLLVVPGLGLLLRNVWIFFLLPVTVAAFYLVMIQEEEKYLKHTFEGEWEAYRAKTPCWI